MKYRFKHIALGGTFDLLHKGHTSLIQKASKDARLIALGITTDIFCRKNGKFQYQNQNVRRREILNYLKINKLLGRTKIVWLKDIFGTTIKDQTIDSIVVSKETISGARQINYERQKKKFKPLKIIVAKEINAQDGKKISSGRIRDGIINRNGINYRNILGKISGKRLNEKIRAKLKIPFGKIISNPRSLIKSSYLISVGDVTTKTILAFKIKPKLSIVDFMVNRKQIYYTLSQLGFISPNPDAQIINPPGTITKSLIEEVEKEIRNNLQNQVILVDGEEDLAAIPAILMSPLGSTVCYGQPGKGMVKVEINEQTKEKVVKLFQN